MPQIIIEIYRYNWPPIVIIYLQTQYTIAVLYDKVIILTAKTRLLLNITITRAIGMTASI